jgi:phytoene dehydrogenase-like protein
MSIYVHNAPYDLQTGTWEAAKPLLLHAVTRVLAEYAPGLPRLVLEAQVLMPQEIESDFGFFGGHPFHGELAIDQLYAMRPLLGLGAYRGPLRGLYLCGAGTHPGGFMTGLSGRFAAEQVLRDSRRKQ